MSGRYAPVDEIDSLSDADSHARAPPFSLTANGILRSSTNRYTRALSDDVDMDFEDPVSETMTPSRPHVRLHGSQSPPHSHAPHATSPHLHTSTDLFTHYTTAFASTPFVRLVTKHCSLWRTVAVLVLIVTAIAVYANWITPMGTRMLSAYMPELHLLATNPVPPHTTSFLQASTTTPPPSANQLPTYISTCLTGSLPTDLTILSSLIMLSRLSGRSILLSDRPLGLPHARMLPEPMQARALLKGRAVRVDIKRKRVFTPPVHAADLKDGGDVKKSGAMVDEEGWQLLAWARAHGWLNAIGLDRYFSVGVVEKEAGDKASEGSRTDSKSSEPDTINGEQEGVESVWVRSTSALQAWVRSITGTSTGTGNVDDQGYGYMYGSSHGSLGIALEEVLDLAGLREALSAPLSAEELAYLQSIGVDAPAALLPGAKTERPAAERPAEGVEDYAVNAAHKRGKGPELVSVRTPPFSFFHKHCVRVDALYCLADLPLRSDRSLRSDPPFGSDSDACRAAASGSGCTDCVFAHDTDDSIAVPTDVVEETVAAAVYVRNQSNTSSTSPALSSNTLTATAAKWRSFLSSVSSRRDVALRLTPAALPLLLRAPHQHIHLSAPLAAALTPATGLANAPAALWPGIPRAQLILPATSTDNEKHASKDAGEQASKDAGEHAAADSIVPPSSPGAEDTGASSPPSAGSTARNAPTDTVTPRSSASSSSPSHTTPATPAAATPATPSPLHAALSRFLPSWSPLVRLEALKVLSALATAVAPDADGLKGRSNVICGVLARRTVDEREKSVVGVRSAAEGDILSQVRVWVRDNSCGAVFFVTDALIGEQPLLDNAAKGVITTHGCQTPSCQDSPTIATAVNMAVMEGLHRVIAPLWQGDEAGLLVARARVSRKLPIDSFQALGQWKYGDGTVTGCPVWENC